ncbi:hypothetical protein M9194_09910 [Vibrio sp. S4M6]|uniref:hypothetical protein n=1 Tax=Vibrio sinus TaxID=2946865 RepID=UPI002029F982|nr:hypothetical protein [Vibrio sinus]MCL9781740.1 hypothetical protein [Vibrio sinus]
MLVVTLDDIDLPQIYAHIGWLINSKKAEAIAFEVAGEQLTVKVVPEICLSNKLLSEVLDSHFNQRLPFKLNLERYIVTKPVNIQGRSIEDILMELVSYLNDELRDVDSIREVGSEVPV